MEILHKGTSVYFEDEGKGTAVVFLHGFLENSTIWKEVKSYFVSKYRVISIDLPGHGKTGCFGYVHTMEMMAEVVEAVLNYLKIRKSVFVGHSMGGYVALAFAEKNPDNVKGLVLLNSTSRADSEEKKKNRDRAIEAVKYNHKSFIRMAITNLFRPKNRKIFAEEIKELKKQALQTPLQGIVAALEGMKIRDDREVLLHFSPYRKMIIIGKKDPVLNYNDLLEQTRNNNVEAVELEDGHMSYVENQEEFVENLLIFLKSI
ncbi:alpha/beta fold hydrolase [Zhouia amylolytica]|uniref:Putative hydrolase or acyltransferase of alpha/beta superfamily n=1 Tax=Zhouia amylolytica AD3 TaxID=1286632 RepID=W2UJK8_9FLAO|nr:alpha/beta hydrolase [Zhouia amylolytica]ETN94154.1 putative hydrolase or acyltransferase of alpha/beta superfamily [Zhouia amylolytica AD3]